MAENKRTTPTPLMPKSINDSADDGGALDQQITATPASAEELELSVRPRTEEEILAAAHRVPETPHKKRTLDNSDDASHSAGSPAKIQKNMALTTPQREPVTPIATPKSKAKPTPKSRKKKPARGEGGRFVRKVPVPEEPSESDHDDSLSDELPDDPMSLSSPFKGLDVDTILNSGLTGAVRRTVKSMDLFGLAQSHTPPPVTTDRRSSMPSIFQPGPAPQTAVPDHENVNRAPELTGQDDKVKTPPQPSDLPLKIFPRDYEIAPPRPLSDYSEEELRACGTALRVGLDQAPGEIIWNIFKDALDFHLVVPQRPTSSEDVTRLGEPVLGLRCFPRVVRDFGDNVTNCCLVGLYPIVTFDLSNPNGEWMTAQEYWASRPTQRILLELKGFDWCHLHALGNFVEFIAESKFLARHDKQERIYPACHRSLAYKRQRELEDIAAATAKEGEKTAAEQSASVTAKDGENTAAEQGASATAKEGEKTAAGDSTNTVKGKGKAKKQEKPKPVEHVLYHARNWDPSRYHPTEVQQNFGPDRDSELDDVVNELINIGIELRNDNRTKTRSAYTRAVYKWAVSKRQNDSLSEERSKEICGRLLRSPQEKRADGSGFQLWYKRETRTVHNR